MIGTIEIKCHAAKPQMPLPPVFSFRGSPSSLRILDLPRRIGEWQITAVKVAATYPDNSITVADAARVGNVWVCTFAGCNVSGKTENGIQILADGTNENGEPVTGYVLGCGDLYILNRDASIAADDDKWYVRYCETVPTNPALTTARCFSTMAQAGLIFQERTTRWTRRHLRRLKNVLYRMLQPNGK